MSDTSASNTVRYYVQIDASTNKAENIYTSENYPGVVLPSSIEVSESRYSELYRVFQKGYIVTYHPEGPTFTYVHPIYNTIERAREYKLAQINTAAEDALQIFLGTYPRAETISWDIQEMEARMYVAEPTEATKAKLRMLPNLAKERGVDLLDLCVKVIYKADLFASSSGSIFGRRQRMEDDITVSESIEEILDLVVDYSDIVNAIYDGLGVPRPDGSS